MVQNKVFQNVAGNLVKGSLQDTSGLFGWKGKSRYGRDGGFGRQAHFY